MLWTICSCLKMGHFPSFVDVFDFVFVKFEATKQRIIAVKRLIQRRNNMTWCELSPDHASIRVFIETL